MNYWVTAEYRAGHFAICSYPHTHTHTHSRACWSVWEQRKKWWSCVGYHAYFNFDRDFYCLFFPQKHTLDWQPDVICSLCVCVCVCVCVPALHRSKSWENPSSIPVIPPSTTPHRKKQGRNGNKRKRREKSSPCDIFCGWDLNPLLLLLLNFSSHSPSLVLLYALSLSCATLPCRSEATLLRVKPGKHTTTTLLQTWDIMYGDGLRLLPGHKRCTSTLRHNSTALSCGTMMRYYNETRKIKFIRVIINSSVSHTGAL